MLSIQFVREHPEEVRRALARRNTEAPIEEVLALDGERRRVLTEVESLRAERNALSEEVGELSREAKTAETKEAKHAEHRRSDLVAALRIPARPGDRDRGAVARVGGQAAIVDARDPEHSSG